MKGRSLVEKASTSKPILSSLHNHTRAALTQPTRFLLSKPHGHVFALYAATYTVANGTETITKHSHPSLSGALTFAATFAVNIPLGVWKDIRFAQFFGAGASQVPVPKTATATAAKTGALPVPPRKTGSAAATATLLIRDAVTIYGSFTLAQSCADLIPDSVASHPYSKTVFTQLVVPVLSQLIATPLHLLGLDLYNRQYRVPVRDRAALVWRDLGSATAVRCARIVPAFGVGCLVNMGLRGVLHGWVD
ncbi:uncharacterized protein DSM5745_02422 [Aspergillus mulundensis]|uniref:Sequence orphan n=1 Tax=Aspergillus mulundensis TaxID=1810919 RepID=A0A3D8SWE5_9EURO|nr:Uncharacterized protein DSM5745_02422 [Aspergillus mulundensis]RDW90647.1 Uncharacterized protein DSM5745_02422 [Aspergillus mulundensis]